PVADRKVLNQQSSILPHSGAGFGGNNQPQQQQQQQQFYTSNVQGPPPGLKTTGTPPVSGGMTFGQGHGFATGGLPYAGVGAAGRGNANEELMRNLLHRGGAGSRDGGMAGGRGESFSVASPPNHYTTPHYSQQQQQQQHGYANSVFSDGEKSASPGGPQQAPKQRSKKKQKQHDRRDERRDERRAHARGNSDAFELPQDAGSHMLQSRFQAAAAAGPYGGGVGAHGYGNGMTGGSVAGAGYGGRW
ncbi:transcriptional repressor general negative regulator of transcription subunit 4, partial [Teratosphaeriaceae sp. CCFEE 6253]